MIKIECTLKTRNDLHRLTPLELKIADCLTKCYYENDDLNPSSTKEESLPILLYFNILRHIISSLRKDPLPRQLLGEFYKRLSTSFKFSDTNYKEAFTLIAGMQIHQPSFFFEYKVNYESDRTLIWGGLYQLIQADQVLIPTQKRSLTQSMINHVKDSCFRSSCFEPFLRSELVETQPTASIQPVDAEKPLCDALTAVETPSIITTVSGMHTVHEAVVEDARPYSIEVDELLELASQQYHNDPDFLRKMKALLVSAVNNQSGGNIQTLNLIKSKLKLLNDKVEQHKEVEKKCISTRNFLHLILHPNPKKLLKRLHQLIDGRRGAAVGAVLLRAQQMGYLSKVPTHAEFVSEFTLIGNWTAIHNYMNDNSPKALAKANQIIIFKGE